MITATADQIKALCDEYAIKKYGATKLKEWEKDNKEIWYIPVLNEEKNIVEKEVVEVVDGKDVKKVVEEIVINTQVKHLAIFKLVDRIIMGQAQEKLAQGFYIYVEYLMRETLLNDDDDGNFIIDDERAFLSAAPDFNKIVDGINTALVKR